MSDQESERPEPDPFEPVIKFYDAWAKSWADTLSETVSSKSFAESMGKQLESSLDAMALARRQVSELMEQYLRRMSLPTRKEVVSLAERLTNIEMRADDLDAKLDEVLDRLKELQASLTGKE
jgi:chromosome segregation ATPase